MRVKNRKSTYGKPNFKNAVNKILGALASVNEVFANGLFEADESINFGGIYIEW